MPIPWLRNNEGNVSNKYLGLVLVGMFMHHLRHKFHCHCCFCYCHYFQSQRPGEGI